MPRINPRRHLCESSQRNDQGYKDKRRADPITLRTGHCDTHQQFISQSSTTSSLDPNTQRRSPLLIHDMRIPDRPDCRYVPMGSGAYLSRHRFEEGEVVSEPSFGSSKAPTMEVAFQRGVSGRFHRTRQRTLNTRRHSPASQSDREPSSSIPDVQETTRSPSGVVIDPRSPIASLGPTVRRIPPGLRTEPVIRSGAVIVTRGRGRRIAR